MLAELRRQNVTLEEVKERVDWYLRDTRVVAAFIPQHIKNLESLFRPWLP